MKEDSIYNLVAFACRTCNKVDWMHTKEQTAKPEHVSYRGVDLGDCPGKMVRLYGLRRPDEMEERR